jgi:hypothetical protein
MKKHFVSFLLFIIASLSLHAAVQDSVKQKDEKRLLRSLLSERKERFAQYTEHLDDKSGFFGNQTKKDLREINEVLKDIVRTDNTIIIELERLLDQRKFENFRSEYETKRAGHELVTLQEQNEKLIAQNDTLVKQLQMVQGTGQYAERRSNPIYIFCTFFFGAILLFLGLLEYRKRRQRV